MEYPTEFSGSTHLRQKPKFLTLLDLKENTEELLEASSGLAQQVGERL